MRAPSSKRMLNQGGRGRGNDDVSYQGIRAKRTNIARKFVARSHAHRRRIHDHVSSHGVRRTSDVTTWERVAQRLRERIDPPDIWIRDGNGSNTGLRQLIGDGTACAPRTEQQNTAALNEGAFPLHRANKPRAVEHVAGPGSIRLAP